MPLGLIRELFDDQERFARAIMAMLNAGEVRLIGADGVAVASWRWREELAAASEVRLSITEAGARRA